MSHETAMLAKFLHPVGVTPPARDAWMDEALCAQTDPEMFFPDRGGSSREAKKVCAECDVREQCLAYALAHDVRVGVWGGLTSRERRRLRRLAS